MGGKEPPESTKSRRKAVVTPKKGHSDAVELSQKAPESLKKGHYRGSPVR